MSKISETARELYKESKKPENSPLYKEALKVWEESKEKIKRAAAKGEEYCTIYSCISRAKANRMYHVLYSFARKEDLYLDYDFGAIINTVYVKGWS